MHGLFFFKSFFKLAYLSSYGAEKTWKELNETIPNLQNLKKHALNKQ